MANPLSVGIDQSYRSTAYVIHDGEDVVAFGVISTDKIDDVYTRARYIADELVRVINFHKCEVAHIEGLAMGTFGNATRDLAGLLFTIILAIRERCQLTSIQEVSPTSLKKKATGNGKAKKEEMINCLPKDVLSKFLERGYKKTNGLTDLADAYFLSL